MENGGAIPDDVTSFLIPMDDLSPDEPSPVKDLDLDPEEEFRLTADDNEQMRQLLDSATRHSVDRFDLRDGFYSEPRPVLSWHCLTENEASDHHRANVFPHTWQPLSSLDDSNSDHRRQGHRSSPRHADLKSDANQSKKTEESSKSRQLHKKRSMSPPIKKSAALRDGGHPGVPYRKSLSCEVVLEEELDDAQSKLVKLGSDGARSENDQNESVEVAKDDSDLVGCQSDAYNLQYPVIYSEEEEGENILRDRLESPLFSGSAPAADQSRPKVSFILGADADEVEQEVVKEPRLSEKPGHSERQSKQKSRGRQRNQRSPSATELSDRRRRGSEVCFTEDVLKTVPTEIDEASTLEAIHLEEMANHRFDESKGLQRRRISHHSVVHIGHVKKAETAPTLKRKLTSEHQPHKMFVELDELRLGENKEWAWHEKARWIKFEEEVEEHAQRWGKPHVSSLSFHSLLELRRCIESAAIMLDLDAVDLPTIVNHIVEQLVQTDQLPLEAKDPVIKALLLRHSHNSMSGKTDSSTVGHDLDALSKSKRDSEPEGMTRLKSCPESSLVPDETNHRNNDQSTNQVKVTVVDGKITSNPSASSLMANVVSPNSPTTTARHHSEPHILKRIPDGAEATNVLVGSVEFLERPIMAFVRLRYACNLGNLTEVPLPVRFIFLLMGPENCNLDYHEIGRSLSTLMADEQFHDTAYVADNRNDLLDGFNKFLHESIVLPPGEWDKKTLLPIMDMARQKLLKRRRTKADLKSSIGTPEKAEKSDDPLKRTGRFFGGLVNDVRRRYPHYVSDLRDGLNLQCLATFFFVYFACLSPAITFGGLLGDKTNKWMGVSEMLVSTAICGVTFSLLSGQPLIIIGATGPVLVFEEALYKICESMGIDFLPFRCWVSLWITVIAVAVVMLEGSFLVRYITRFTEEIFASLISLIFIYEVFKKLYFVFQKNPLKEYYPPPIGFACKNNNTNITSNPYNDNSTEMTTTTDNVGNNMAAWLESAAGLPLFPDFNFTEQSDDIANCSEQGGSAYGRPNTALLSLILTFGTFLIAYFLKQFRNSQFLGRSARRAIGDFGVPITIILMVLVDFLIPDTYTEKLDVPDGVQPTAPYKRGWFVNPVGFSEHLPPWTVFAAIIPALLVFILLFMEAQITSMIVNKKERKLKKGYGGYHLDLFIIGILSTVCGFLGLPLMCSATVRSVTHVSALSVFSRTHAPGEKPQLLKVKEQRVTSLAVHVMVGVSVLLGPVLRKIPLSVLFGVFLYMGIASMSGIQMLHRVQLMFMPVKHHPDVGYARRVRWAKMNLYTFAQLLCLAILWVVKSTQAALAFPFFLILMVPVRLHILRFLFTRQELEELDKDEEFASDNEEDELDFYAQAHMPI